MSFSNKERLDSNENPFDHLFDQIGEVSLDALSNIYFVGRRTVKPEVLQQWFTQDRSQLWHIPAPDSQPISDERREFEGLADEFRQIWEDISSSPTIAMRAKRSLLDYQQKIQR